MKRELQYKQAVIFYSNREAVIIFMGECIIGGLTLGILMLNNVT